MFNQPPLRYLPPTLRILSLFSLMMLSAFMFTYLAAFIVHGYMGVDNVETFISSNAEKAANPAATLVFLGLSSGIGMFLLPALMFSVLTSGNAGVTLKIDSIPSIKYITLAIGITLSAGVFIALLTEVNMLIPESPTFSGLIQQQKEQGELINSVFAGAGTKRFILLVVVLAVIPALGEEMLFRGILQPTIVRSGLGDHTAIIITSFVFAAMHLMIYQVFALFWMGLMLGYLFYYTQSLWVSIIAHFLNNFITVLLKYLFVSGVVTTDVTEIETLPLYATLPAALIMFGLLWLLKHNRTLPQPIFTEQEKPTA